VPTATIPSRDNPGYQSFPGHLPDLLATIAILCND
jgi:hypothetical protein